MKNFRREKSGLRSSEPQAKYGEDHGEGIGENKGYEWSKPMVLTCLTKIFRSKIFWGGIVGISTQPA